MFTKEEFARLAKSLASLCRESIDHGSDLKDERKNAYQLIYRIGFSLDFRIHEIDAMMDDQTHQVSESGSLTHEQFIKAIC